MMRIDIRKLNAQKQYTGSMEFEYSAPENLIDIPFVQFGAPVKVRFDYELYEDDSLEIRGTVRFQLVGQCSRCLKDATANVEGELDAYFQPFKECEDYSYVGGVVDVTQAVNEAIMASMPFTLSCGEDCKVVEFSSETDK